MAITFPKGLPRESMQNSIYDFEHAGKVVTGEIGEQQEEAYFVAQARNFRICLILMILFGVLFLYSLFGMWRP